MPRKKIRWTENKVNQFIKEGRGQGEGADYIPWIKVGEFSSQGRCHRVKDIYNGRTHHFFSDLELDYYYYLLWNDSIVDIREQFPLFPITITEQIAEDMQIKHPSYAGFNTIMTTDFLITKIDSQNNKTYHARSIKYSTDLKEGSRTYEKLLLEQEFWRQRNVECQIITEQSFSQVKARNIKRILQNYQYDMNDIFGFHDEDLKRRFLNDLRNSSEQQLNQFCKNWDLRMQVKTGTFLRYFYILSAHKEIPIKVEKITIPHNKIKDLIDYSLINANCEVKVYGDLS